MSARSGVRALPVVAKDILAKHLQAALWQKLDDTDGFKFRPHSVMLGVRA
jgi:hypothetical protein